MISQEEIQELIDNFDVYSYLDDVGITYFEAGYKNTSEGWISIECPFPLCTDQSNHMGIEIDSLLFSCFKCGETGNIINLIREIERCGFYKSLNILQEHPKEYLAPKTFSNSEAPKVERCSFSSEILIDEFPAKFKRYLKKRNFNPDLIIEKYKIKGTKPIGKFANRIIIPYILNREMVTYSGRTIIEGVDPPYLHLSKNSSVLPVKDMIYNLDTVKENCMIVEGVTDVWRIGDGCVATSGIKYSEKQINMLLKKKIKKFFILYDPDAVDMAYKLANKLSLFAEHTEVLNLKKGDPGSMKDSDALWLRKEFKLND